MSPEPYLCDLDPETNKILKMYLIKNVQNTEELKQNVLKGIWNCTVLRASLILDPFQVAVATNRAVVSEKLNTMITRTLNGEILYNLSLTKNINTSLSKSGVGKKDVLVCFIITPDEDKSSDILSQIQGEICPMSDLTKFTDMKQVKNLYKVNKEMEHALLLDVIVSRMVTKNIVSY